MRAGYRIPILLVLLLIAAPVSGLIVSPNDTSSDGSEVLQVDGFVTTKFATVGTDVSVLAKVRGAHTDTLVTADILHFPDIDPLDSFSGTSPTHPPVVVDTISLQSEGQDEFDPSATVWKGTYTIPVTASGGVYAASISAQSGNQRATDDVMQLRALFGEQVATVLQSIDDTWDVANPTAEIAGEFTTLQSVVMNNGGWAQFVDDACRGSGALGSQALWEDMIDAGFNQYDMSEGAAFLEELMNFLDSDDAAASIAFHVAVLLYLDDFPIPRSLSDFEDIPPYIAEFDLIENFTQFEGTGDFEAAYDAMTATGEWNNITTALDNLANNQRQFEAIQTLMRNIAVLSISDHATAVADGLGAYIGPLLDEDFENMTPFQRFIIRFAEMADKLEETDIIDTDGDDVPDRITWQYEKLLETAEGQAWSAKMSSDSPYVNTAFNEFNTLPEDIVGHVFDALENPAWEQTGEVLENFGEWMVHFSGGDIDDEYGSYYDWENSTHHPSYDSMPEFMTFEHNMYTTQIGIELEIYDADGNHPSYVRYGVTESNGQERYTVKLESVVSDDQWERYAGVLEIPVFRDQMWDFDDIFSELTDDGILSDENDEFSLNMELLSQPMIAQMAIESNDELFVVSAVGVLVESPQTVLMGDDITVNAQVYNGIGPVEGADVEIAILRASPQAALDFLADNGFDALLEGDEDDDDDDDDSETNHFYCDNGIEINQHQLYLLGNGQDDCGDWSDETAYETYYPCDNGWQGIQLHELNNDNFDCDDESDEGVTWLDHISISSDTIYECEDGNGFVSDYDLNDGYDDCDDASDEQPDAADNLDSTDHLELYLSGDGVTDEDDDGTDEYCYMFDVDVWDGHQTELFNDYVLMSSWGSASVDLGETPSGLREWSAQGTLLQYEFDDSTAEGCGDEASFDATQVTYESEEREFDGAIKRLINNAYWNLHHEDEEKRLSGEIYYDSVWEDDDSYNLLVMVVDGEENGPPYTSLQQADFYVGSDNYSTSFSIENIDDLDPGYYCLHFDLREDTTAHTVVDSLGYSGDEHCFTLEGEEEEEGLDIGADISPELIDSFFTDGPFEVFTTVEGVTDVNGQYQTTFSPSMPGAYLQVVQAKVPHGATETLTGIGASYSVTTNGSIGVGGMTHVADFSDFPIYTVDKEPGQLHTITISPIMPSDAYDEEGEFTVLFAIGAANFGEFFPDISNDSWGESSSFELDFQEGDTSRTQEIRLPAMSAFAMMVLKDGEIWPRAIHAGFILASPENLTLTGDLGPGQTTNIALTDSSAERILAIAAPQKGTDPALVDVPTISDLVYDMVKEGILSWAAQERNIACGNTLDEAGPRDGFNTVCPDTETKYDLSDEEGLELFQNLLADMNSIAWGEGSSADLRLPLLSSPIDDYTVLSIAQVGTGSGATITSAIGTQTAVPNPSPPEIQSVTVSFSPANPMPGDTVQILVVEKESSQPIEGMSVTLMNGENIVASELTDAEGKADFVMVAGTLQFRVSGGMYVPTSLILIVTDAGTDLEGGEELPVDSDGDGILDAEDAFPTDSSESVDTDGDGVGDNSDVFPTDPDESADSDGDGIGDNADSEGISAMVAGAAIGMLVFVIIGVVGAIMFLSRSGDGEMPEAIDYAADSSWSEPPSSAPGGGKPSPTVRGSMRDGYEVVEYPDGSGSWWWRDPNTGTWNEWAE